MPSSIDFSKIKDLAKGIVGIPNLQSAKNYSRGCITVIFIFILLLAASLSAVYGEQQNFLKTGELSENFRGSGASSLADKYPGCGFLLNLANSLSKEKLKQALLTIPGGKIFAKNEDILDGFVNAGERYHISNVYIAAHAGLESAWGTSKISRDKKNLFGYGATDSNPYGGANSFSTYREGIHFVMGKVKSNYLTPGGKYYITEKSIPASHRYKAEAIKRASGIRTIEPETLEAMNVYYASDVAWASKIKSVMSSILEAAGKKPELTNNCVKN